jgi:hypothetical protein
MPQRRKKHGVGTHSPNRRARRETVYVFKQAQKQHAKELQMKRTEEEEATATTKLVRETGRPRQDGDIQRCVGIAAVP